MRKLLLLLGMCMAMLQLFAQSRTVTGKVTDEKGNPLAGVSVQVKGTSVGTTTTNAGTFSLSAPSTAKTLVITSVGMTTREVAIGSGPINVALNYAANEIEDVVVVGYGSGKKVGSVVGAFTKVNAERIQDRPSANVMDALQGKVPGLQIFTSSGEPSASSSVRLHGVGSLGASSTPLYVLDGVPIDNGTIVSLNPQDFESITVLKDASATSIYGSRAANGVIYITSKKGSATNPTITLQTQYGWSNVLGQDYFNSFMNTKELTDYWVKTGYRTQAQIDALLAQYPYDTKWSDVYYKENAPTYQANLGFSGGGAKTTYYVSGSYFHQEGLAYRSGFDRYTLRSNINSSITNWMKFGLNLSMGLDERQTNPYGSNSTNRGLALLAPPFYTPNDPATGQRYELIPGWARYHPEYLADKNPSNSKNVQFNPSAFVQINPLRNLTFKTQAGIEAYDFTTSSQTLPSFIGSLNNGAASESFTRGVSKTINNTLEYKFKVANDHNFTALVGNEFISNRTESFSGSSTGQTDDRLILISAGPSNRNASQSRTENAYVSYFSRLEYNFNNKYFLDGSFRQDQASRFGKENRTANFWSAGAMWKAKKEKFLQNVNWLNELDINASIGTSGNSSIGDYQSLPLVGTNTFNNETGWGISAAGNPELSWESQKQTTVGFKATMFNKLRLDVDYYNRVTSNMLISVPYPYTSGFSAVTSNVGSLKNSGVDVGIEFDVVSNKKAYLTPYVNFNYNKNEVTELFQGKQYWIIPNTGVSWAIGQPVSFFYPIFAQVNPQTGNPEWYLPNSNPDLIVNSRQDPSAVTTTFNSTALQQSTGIKRYPPLNGGFGLNGGYNGFYIQADFSFSQGKYLINNDRYFFENPNQFPGFNQARSVQNYWQKAGDVAQFPKYGIQFTQFDSRLIEDASFMRLKVLTLGYNIPTTLVSKTKVMKSAKFYVTGRNLLTWTKYLGPDPEVDSNLTLGANPNTKQVAVGLDIQF